MYPEKGLRIRRMVCVSGERFEYPEKGLRIQRKVGVSRERFAYPEKGLRIPIIVRDQTS